MSYKDFEIFKSKIFEDVFIFKPNVFYDHRGTIFTSYFYKIHDEYLPNNLKFIHDKFAESKKNVLRGLHGDNKTWKLVSCLKGEIFEVVVDMRPESTTFLKWESWILNDKNKMEILIPPKFVNGYCVLSEEAIFHYKLAYDGQYIDAPEQMIVKWNDSRLKIDWPCKNPILQDRDK